MTKPQTALAHSTLGQYQNTFASARQGTVILRGMIGMCIAMAMLTLSINRNAMTFTLAAILLAIAAAAGGYIWWDASLKVESYDQGLIYTHGFNRDVIPFGDITEVRDVPQYGNRTYRGPIAWRYDLQLRSGKRLRLAGLHQIRKLGQMLSETIANHHWPDTWQRLQTGETLTFGKVQISVDGIGVKREFIPWSEVELLGYTPKAHFVVGRRGDKHPSIHLLAWDVANLPLLLRCYQALTQSRA